MGFSFTKATKEDARLRLALLGPAGSGKTFTALAIACALGDRVAVIDTEHGSASKYAGRFGFDRLNLDTFAPATYVEAIHAAEAAGYDVIVVDSLSHAWMGKGGALEMVDRAAKRGGASGNSFGAWRDVTPQHNALVEAMIACRCHIIATLRVKTDYEQVKDDRGKTTVRKIGLAPVQRDGLEYEFDVVMDINADHEGIVSKTRCPELTDGIFPRPGADVAKILKRWLTDGEPAGQSPNELPADNSPTATLQLFNASVAEIQLPGEAVAVWIKYRAELASLPTTDRESAWRALCKRTEDVGHMTNAKVWLKKCLAEEDARRGNHPEDDGPRGGQKLASAPSTTDATGDRAAANDSSAPPSASVAHLPSVPEWATTREGIEAHLSDLTARRHLENSIRAHGRRLGGAYLKPAAERLIALTPAADSSARLEIIGATMLVEAWAQQGPLKRAATR